MSTEQRLIDANKVAQDVRENNKANFFQADWSSKRVCELLESAPTVDAAPVVHGRWLKPSEQGLPKKFDNFGAVCSVCGFYSESPNNYCPNCGCKMDTETIKRQAEYVYEGVSRYCEAIDKNNLVNEIVEEMRNALR